jgi:DNA-binding NarL/FixJ family response regulator
MAEGLAGMLTEGGCQDVRVASTAESVLKTVDEARPDIVIIDGCMCTDSMDLVHALSTRGQPVALVIGPDWSGSFVLDAILAGAGGCISYDEQAAKFAASLGLIAQGLVVMSKTIAEIVAATARDNSPLRDHERNLIFPSA